MVVAHIILLGETKVKENIDIMAKRKFKLC